MMIMGMMKVATIKMAVAVVMMMVMMVKRLAVEVMMMMVVGGCGGIGSGNDDSWR